MTQRRLIWLIAKVSGAVVCAVNFQSRDYGFDYRRLWSHTSFLSLFFHSPGWLPTTASACRSVWSDVCAGKRNEKDTHIHTHTHTHTHTHKHTHTHTHRAAVRTVQLTPTFLLPVQNYQQQFLAIETHCSRRQVVPWQLPLTKFEPCGTHQLVALLPAPDCMELQLVQVIRTSQPCEVVVP